MTRSIKSKHSAKGRLGDLSIKFSDVVSDDCFHG